MKFSYYKLNIWFFLILKYQMEWEVTKLDALNQFILIWFIFMLISTSISINYELYIISRDRESNW